LPKLVLLYPFIKLLGTWAMRKERVRFKTLDEANVPLVQAMNTTDMLLGRTIITKSVKSA
jgi:hypothetical protein